MVKKLTPVKAVEVLPYVDKRAALPLQKVIKTALANARQQGVNESDLQFAAIEIGQGPRLKRWRAGSRGRIKPYTRDMSHIRVVLKQIEVKQTKKAVEEKPKRKVVKK